MDSENLILSPLMPETVAARIDERKEEEDMPGKTSERECFWLFPDLRVQGKEPWYPNYLIRILPSCFL
jgi:hypothetical protein